MNRNYSAHAATGPVSTVSKTESGKSGSRDAIEWKPCVFIPVADAIESNSEAAWRAWDRAQDEALLKHVPASVQAAAEAVGPSGVIAFFADYREDEAACTRVAASGKPTLGNLVDRLGNWPVPEVSGGVKTKDLT